jgi:hypothetical protein
MYLQLNIGRDLAVYLISYFKNKSRVDYITLLWPLLFLGRLTGAAGQCSSAGHVACSINIWTMAYLISNDGRDGIYMGKRHRKVQEVLIISVAGW